MSGDYPDNDSGIAHTEPLSAFERQGLDESRQLRAELESTRRELAESESVRDTLSRAYRNSEQERDELRRALGDWQVALRALWGDLHGLIERLLKGGDT